MRRPLACALERFESRRASSLAGAVAGDT